MTRCTLLIADETSDLRKFYMTENKIGNDNEYDNGDEFDKVQNTFPTGSGLFELSDTPGTMPSRVWRRILPVTISCQRGTSTARLWDGMVWLSHWISYIFVCSSQDPASILTDASVSQVPRSQNIRLVTNKSLSW